MTAGPSEAELFWKNFKPVDNTFGDTFLETESLFGMPMRNQNFDIDTVIEPVMDFSINKLEGDTEI